MKKTTKKTPYDLQKEIELCTIEDLRREGHVNPEAVWNLFVSLSELELQDHDRGEIRQRKCFGRED